MDTSETYIKMRLAAVPDLGQGTPPQLAHGIGDDIVAPVWLNDVAFIDHKGDVYYSVWSAGGCQLEREDQLQAMVSDASDEYWLHHVIENFYLFCIPYEALVEWEKEDEYIRQFTSMEQLWLVFVMKTLHNKVWTGTEWKGERPTHLLVHATKDETLEQVVEKAHQIIESAYKGDNDGKESNQEAAVLQTDKGERYHTTGGREV